MVDDEYQNKNFISRILNNEVWVDGDMNLDTNFEDNFRNQYRYRKQFKIKTDLDKTFTHKDKFNFSSLGTLFYSRENQTSDD